VVCLIFSYEPGVLLTLEALNQKFFFLFYPNVTTKNVCLGLIHQTDYKQDLFTLRTQIYKMASANSASTAQVILSSPSDWRPWMQTVRTAAEEADIWKYVNPDTRKEDLPSFEEPEELSFKTVNSAALAFKDLDIDEREELRASRPQSHIQTQVQGVPQAKVCSEIAGQIYPKDSG
jgi:hypothetical protein